MLWMWRDTPDAMSNHTLSYARSRDLKNWESSTGKPIARPITMANAEVIDAVKPGGGLVNMTYALGWDAKTTSRRGLSSLRHQRTLADLRRSCGWSGGWQLRQISHWKFRWEFPGGGSQVKQVSVSAPAADAQGNLVVEYSAKQAGAGRWRLDAETLAVIEHLPPAKQPQ